MAEVLQVLVDLKCSGKLRDNFTRDMKQNTQRLLLPWDYTKYGRGVMVRNTSLRGRGEVILTGYMGEKLGSLILKGSNRF